LTRIIQSNQYNDLVSKNFFTKKWWAGAIALLVVAGLFGIFTLKRRVEPFTADQLKTARLHWSKVGPKNYEMDVIVSGVQRGHHHIVVENGKVVKMSTNGEQVNPSAWGYWSIEGMFEFLEQELSHAERPNLAYGVSDPSEVFLTAQFDPIYGYPQRFLRQVFGKNFTIEWNVQDFQPSDKVD